MATDGFLEHPLAKFLQSHVSTEKTNVSMTGMGLLKGKWFISDAEYPKFLELLNDYLFVKKLRPLSLVEQRVHDGRVPLLIDLDFKYPEEKSLIRSFGKQEIQTFVQDIVSKLSYYFDLSDKPRIRFFVTLRPEPYIARKVNNVPGKDIKDGVHVVSPDIVMTSDQQKILREVLTEDGAVAKAFGNSGYRSKLTDKDIYDESLTHKNGWFFYGESKQDVPPYQLVHVFCYTTKTGKLTEQSISNYPPNLLLDILSIRYQLKESLKVRSEVASEYDKIYEKLNTAPPTPQLTGMAGGVIPEEMEAWSSVLAMVHPESEIETAKRLVLECLSVERADNYNTWIRVGWCIRNIDATQDGFNLWIDFSRKSSKFNEAEIEMWRKSWAKGLMQHVGDCKQLTFGSLVRWAQEDNMEQYKNIKNDDILNYIRKVALCFKGGTHHHCAEIMRKVYGDVYKCSVDQKSYEWYRYTGNIWETLPQGIALKDKMSHEIARLVSDAKESYKIQMVNNKNMDEKQMLEHMQKFLKMEENLYNANFKDSILKECIQSFYEEHFSQKMNINPFTVGCANGILHLRDPVYDETGVNVVSYRVVLKPGRPNDYVSHRLGHLPPDMEALEYEEYREDDPAQQEIMDFFGKLFPDDDVREYILTLAASCLEGQNREQCYYIMTGVGGNGKTKFVQLMQNTLGEYVSSLSTTALTRKRPDSGAANPDIIGIKNKRFIIMQEPDEREQLNTARMKQFSGEDIVEARGLFKDQERFKISGKFFMSCNRLPPIHSMDDGTWRRIRVIPFKSRFVSASDPALDPANNIYPRDNFLDEKLTRWRKPFLSLLVHYYRTKYMVDGIKSVPKEVKKFSDEYKQSHDSFSKFRMSMLRDASSAPPHLRASLMEYSSQFKDIKRAYRIWSGDASSGAKLSENELKIRCQEAFGTPADGKTFKGLRIFNNEEEVEKFDKGEEDDE
jgi:P4 family phage/plasmid primase-like protien